MGIVPGRHPLPITDFYAFFKQRVVRTVSSASGALPSSIHRHSVCVTTNLRITRSEMIAISKLPPRTGRANPQVRQCASTRMKQGTFLLLRRRIRDSDHRRRESRHTTSPYFCAPLGSHPIFSGSFMQVHGQVGYEIGTISRSRIQRNVFFLFCVTLCVTLL